MHLQKFLRNIRKVPVFADNKSTHNIKIFIGNIFDAHILNFTYVLFRQETKATLPKERAHSMAVVFGEVIMETFGERR